LNKLETLLFDNGYARLGEAYYHRQQPEPFQTPAHLISFNPDVASLVGLDPDEALRPEFIDYFSGNKCLPNSDSLAMLYSGHQFGQYVPQLGDGRALLLGQVINKSGESYDLHLKGGGQTAYSRQGDGRAVLRSSVREYLCGEAMHGLGISTTRSLCLIGSSEEVYRESIETGAMLVRVAPSHIRFGSFEIFYYRNEHDRLTLLADYVISKHYKHLVDKPDRYSTWLLEVIDRTARLMAQWRAVGFAHGVMNTDNMSVLGLTLDYGPYGFLDTYDPDYICNHSDHMGRYAFNRQPGIGLWNLSCFAQAILPLLHDTPDGAVEIARDLLGQYEAIYNQYFTSIMSTKLGFSDARGDDEELIGDLLLSMIGNQVDYTIFMRQLAKFNSKSLENNDELRDQYVNRDAFDQWAVNYQQRLQAEGSEDDDRQERMNQVNPRYILRNYMAQQAIEQAEQGDYSEIERLFNLLKDPFSENPGDDAYAAHPPEWASKISVSCSS
jgi:uncharacterized protein YdiU (UPF0061 family)